MSARPARCSRRSPGLHWPPGRIGAPCAAGPGRGASAQPATGRGRFWADVSPLGRVWEMGPKRQPGTAANLVAGQAAGPLGKPNASQNCPQLYQGESGGLEPSTNLVAGQAGAPRGRGPSAEGPPLRGRSALTGGPVPPCAPLPSGGDFNFRSPEGEGNCEPAGAPPPRPARCSRRNLG